MKSTLFILLAFLISGCGSHHEEEASTPEPQIGPAMPPVIRSANG